MHCLQSFTNATVYDTSHIDLELMKDLKVSQIKSKAHLLSVFVLLVVGVVGHGRQELQEAVECVAVACWEHVDQ